MTIGLGSSANRWRAFVLAAWAAGIALLLIAGRYSLFIRARLWPLLLGTLIILLLFLVAMIARPAHAQSRRLPLTAWIRGAMLLLPLLFMTSMLSGNAASGLNSFALQKRSLGMDSASDPFGAVTDNGPVTVNTDQDLDLGYISRHLVGLADKHIFTEGRVYRDESLPPGQIAVFRFIVVCCAADAMPVSIAVESPKSANFKNDDWIRVGGVLKIVERDGQRFPVIDADQIDSIPAPQEPYLSPYGL